MFYSVRHALHCRPVPWKTDNFRLISTNILSRAIVEALPSGLCAIYKPLGWSSNDAVQKIRSILEKEYRRENKTRKHTKIKVGHGGTLDPLAEGVLVLGIGEGTKLMQSYLSGAKGYSAEGLLGQEMDTLDSTGKVTSIVDCSQITSAQISDALQPFRGSIMQKPPMFSALKRDGQTLYELARKGIEVDRELRPVTVYTLNMRSNSRELPYFGLDVDCSGGFYVRTLISDLAQSLGGVAHMTALVRTKQGAFALSDCLREEDWTFAKIRDHIIVSSHKANLDVSTLKVAHDKKL